MRATKFELAIGKFTNLTSRLGCIFSNGYSLAFTYLGSRLILNEILIYRLP